MKVISAKHNSIYCDDFGADGSSGRGEVAIFQGFLPFL